MPSSIKIESGVKFEMIERFNNNSKSRQLRDAFRAMNPGDSFVWNAVSSSLLFTIAAQVGVKIKTRKVSAVGIRVWKK